MSQWLVNGLAEAGLPVVCVETRHMKALLKAQQINKSDRNDARGIAQMMRVGLFKPVHVKTREPGAADAADQPQAAAEEAAGRRERLARDAAELRPQGRDGQHGGLRGAHPRAGGGLPSLAAIVGPMLIVRRVLREQFAVLHRMLLDTVRHDPVCRRLMTAPGVGPVVALTYRATVDQPQRFVHSRAVGASVGLTPRRHQSGEIDYDVGISKTGDIMLRTMLYEAAQSLLTQRRKVVLAEGMGHSGSAAARHAPGDRGGGAPPGRDSTSHVG